MSENIPALLANFIKLNTMADGRVRLLLETDHTLPEVAALGLIPGATFGLVRMTQEATKEQAQKETVKRAEEKKPKGGPLAKLAGMWCNDPNFKVFLKEENYINADDPSEAIKKTLGILSRIELDYSPTAALDFETFFRQPYMEWRQQRGLN